MDANNLVTLIRDYNSHKGEIFEQSTNLFTSQVQQQLTDLYNEGNWTLLVNVTQLGISLQKIRRDFRDFDFDVSMGYLMTFGKTIQEEYSFPTFQQFLLDDNYEDAELCNFQGSDIRLLEPFCNALTQKGFGCYVDQDNCQLVITIDVVP